MNTSILGSGKKTMIAHILSSLVPGTINIKANDALDYTINIGKVFICQNGNRNYPAD